ncbi:MAG: biotin transporter BioY [Saprospiraceae bacterium]|nr:biotin transporter BioY [Saprospiraceae bacterium]
MSIKINTNQDLFGRSALKIIASLLFISISSYIAFDIGTIPITGQTLVILIVAFFLTPKESFISLLLYLIIGGLGAPVFAEGTSGLDKLVGNSGGYLVGFLLAAVLVSNLNSKHHYRQFIQILLITFLGTIIILFTGVFRLGTLIGFQKAVEYGLLPFIVGAFIKIGLGSIIVWSIKKWIPNP